MELDHAVAESALVQQLQSQADMVGESWIAPSHDDRGEEQATLINQPKLDGLGNERGTAHGNVASRSRFELLDCFGVERPLDSCSSAGCLLQGFGIQDL